MDSRLDLDLAVSHADGEFAAAGAGDDVSVVGRDAGNTFRDHPGFHGAENISHRNFRTFCLRGSSL